MCNFKFKQLQFILLGLIKKKGKVELIWLNLHLFELFQLPAADTDSRVKKNPVI